MTRSDFMNELESLLMDIPPQERRDALLYYNGYFEDAGKEHEEEIIAELGSPERVASIIKADLNANVPDRESSGCFTENGYQDTLYKDEKYEIIGTARKSRGSQSTGENANSSNGYDNSQNNKEEAYKKHTNIGLIILLCIIAIPVGIPAVASIFGILFGLAAAFLAILFSSGIIGITLMGIGTALIIAGIIKIGIALTGLLLCAAGLILLGLGMLFTMACVLLCKKALPALVRGFVNLCRLPFKNRSVTA